MLFAMSENLDSQTLVADFLREADKVGSDLPSSLALQLSSSSVTRDLMSFNDRTVALNSSVLSIVSCVRTPFYFQLRNVLIYAAIYA